MSEELERALEEIERICKQRNATHRYRVHLESGRVEHVSALHYRRHDGWIYFVDGSEKDNHLGAVVSYRGSAVESIKRVE